MIDNPAPKRMVTASDDSDNSTANDARRILSMQTLSAGFRALD
jgi:hypothetical protein